MLHRLEESEIDGSILDMTLKSGDGGEALMSTLKVDELTMSYPTTASSSSHWSSYSSTVLK